MCVCSLTSASGINYIFGGYENGTLLLWDERNSRNQLHSCQMFPQSGTYIDTPLCLQFEQVK